MDIPHQFFIIDAEDYTIKESNMKIPETENDQAFCYAVTHGYDQPCYKYGEDCPLKIAKKNKEVAVVVHQHYDEQGQLHYHEVHSYPIFDQEGNVQEVIEFSLDITKRKKERKTLERFRDALDSSGDSIFIIDYPTYSFIDVNQRACIDLGYDKEELLELTPFDIKPEIPDDDLMEKFENIINNFNSCKDGCEAVETFETLHLRKDGSTFPVEINLHVFEDLDEEILLVASVRDITKRKQVEKDLKENKQRLEEEINKAKKIHEKTLPRTIPKIEGLKLCAYYQPAAEMGGDFYNTIQIGSKILFYISDITGHGLDAAMMSSFVKNTINSYISLVNENKTPNPAEILSFLDQQYIKENYPEDYFITIILGVIDPENYKLTYSSAGMHMPPLLIDNGELIELSAGNMPISAVIPDDESSYHNEEVELPARATVFIETDGLMEQESEGKMYGKRHHSILQREAHLPPRALAENINNDFIEFRGDHRGDDDITYIIFQTEGKENFSELDFKVKSSLEALEKAKEEIKDFICLHMYDTETVLMAFHEIMINAIEHGNSFDEKKQVQIHCELKEEFLLISVQDEGDAFDWRSEIKKKEEISDIQDEVADRGRGLGFLVTKSAADYFYYYHNDIGNKATFIKLFPDCNL